MITVPVRSQAGTTSTEITLEPALFEAQVNVPVMHQVVVAQMAAWRSGTHATKTRGEVRGGGKKPYRQKGTGRARQGSIRAPHYAGGGVVWGPHPRDHSKRVPKKMKLVALRSALTDRARDGKVAVVDSLDFDVPRTKEAVAVLEALELGSGTVLLVLDARSETIERSFRNLQRVHVLTVDQINTYDILSRDWLVFTRPALERLHARVAPAAAETPEPTATAEPGLTPDSAPTPEPTPEPAGDSVADVEASSENEGGGTE